MQTLGLSSETPREDNFFQRLFWPTISNAYDADVIGRRAFWVCVTIAVLTGGQLAIRRQLAIGLFLSAVYLLGGFGIRQRSLSASILLSVIYGFDISVHWIAVFLGTAPPSNPLLGLVCLALLLSTIRATLLARRWPADGVGEQPEPQDRGVVDVMVNRLPRAVWPVGRYVFYLLAAAYLILSVAGTVMVVQRSHAS